MIIKYDLKHKLIVNVQWHNIKIKKLEQHKT